MTWPASTACTLRRMRISPLPGSTARLNHWALKATERGAAEAAVRRAVDTDGPIVTLPLAPPLTEVVRASPACSASSSTD